MPRVLENFACGKNPQGPYGGEDVVLVSDHFLGVFDGVTSRGRAVEEGLLLQGATPGRWAAELELAVCLKQDPLLISLHRGFRPLAPVMVSFDDRAYLRFVV
jgi:hypothetical protein